MRELEPCSVLLIAKRAGNKQTISPLKQLAEAFQIFSVYHSSHNATTGDPLPALWNHQQQGQAWIPKEGLGDWGMKIHLQRVHLHLYSQVSFGF